VLVLLWPVQLNNLYRFDEHYLAYWHVLISIAVIVLMVLLFRTGEPAVRFGLIWLAVNYLPISNIVPFPSAPMAERYMYLPGLGLWLVLAGLIHRLFLRVSWKSGVICGCLVIIALLGLRTWLRNPDWKNDGTLFSSLVKVDPDSASGHFNLGNYYKDIDLALAQIEWEKSVALEPRNSRAWNQLGTVHLLRGEIEAAESNYLRALREKPGDAEAHYNLATLYERRDMTAQALEQYQLYLRTAPNEHAAIISRVIDKVRAMQSLH
jgi:tetratricopeptide (TPR) repeat protein